MYILAHSVFLAHSQVDGVLDPGNGLYGIHHTHDKVDTRDDHKPHKELVTSPLVALTTADKGSREDERENVEKGTDAAQSVGEGARDSVR